MSPKSLANPTGPIRFAAFELDPRSGVLRKHGIRIRLQDQPFQVLLVLVEKSGHVVTREELQQMLWPATAFGDFDHSLNIAINKIREALGDSAAAPKFIETAPRRGYRFIGEVEADGKAAKPPIELAPPKQTARKIRWAPLAAAVGTTLLVAAAVLWALRPGSPSPLLIRRLTNDHSAKFGPVVTDGVRLYFQAGSEFQAYIAELPLSGGEPTRLASPVLSGPCVKLQDITPDRQQLLVTVGACRSEFAPLWTFRLGGDSMSRVGALLAAEARYSPDGKQIAYAVGRQHMPGSLWIASGDGSNPRRLLEVKGSAVITPLWSPDGQRIAFGQRNQLTQQETAWEVTADGRSARQLLPWHGPRVPVAWTPDRRLLISDDGLLSVMPSRQPQLFPISSGEPRFNSLSLARDGPGFYGIGTTPLGELQRFARGTWEPLLGGVSAELVEYSPDGQRVVYVTYPERELWTRRADGSRPVQLTKSPMQLGVVRWSPDNASIAFLGFPGPGQPMRIYILDASGGTPHLACRKGCGLENGDLTWSHDGRQIVYASEQSLRSLDVSTGEATVLPGSDWLYSPRWSPDGTTLAALDWKSRSSRLRVYRDGKWRDTVDVEGFLKWPFWSHDSKFVWYLNPFRGTIGRYDLLNNRYESVVEIKAEEYTGAIHTWFALTPNDEPMILRRRDIQQIYALIWNSR